MAGVLERGLCRERQESLPPCSTSSCGADQPSYELCPSAPLRHSLLERCRLASRGVDYFAIIAAPATGPRAFITMGFDLHFADLALAGRLTGTKWLLGASTGALRFSALLAASACGSNGDRSAASLTEQLRDHFMGMTYRHGDKPAVLSPMMRALRHKVRAVLVVAVPIRIACPHAPHRSAWKEFTVTLYMQPSGGMCSFYNNYCMHVPSSMACVPTQMSPSDVPLSHPLSPSCCVGGEPCLRCRCCAVCLGAWCRRGSLLLGGWCWVASWL